MIEVYHAHFDEEIEVNFQERFYIKDKEYNPVQGITDNLNAHAIGIFGVDLKTNTRAEINNQQVMKKKALINNWLNHYYPWWE